MIPELSERSREVFKLVVESYVETGVPVGSRFISKRLDNRLSPASIRNTMADLEDAGLLFAPHTSAGRLPTERGMRLFVDGLLQIGELSNEDRGSIDSRCAVAGRNVQEVLTEATGLLSGLSRCAGLVVVPKNDAPLRQIELVSIGTGQALMVMVHEGGEVENRVIDVPPGLGIGALSEASNYLSARLKGRSMVAARADILNELENNRATLDQLTARVVEAGLGVVAGGPEGQPTLIVRGSANLLQNVEAIGNLERIRNLMSELENAEDMLRLIDLAQSGEGVRIFIGSENRLFDQAGCSLIVAPLKSGRPGGGVQNTVGAIGVIGPSRMNYARIIPMVDYTAQMIGRLIG